MPVAQPIPVPPPADIPLLIDGDDSFTIGTNSYTQPSRLYPGEYCEGLNVINRGGVVQTRPGSVSYFDMPAGHLQGCTSFLPIGTSSPFLVFCVDGKVYTSTYPFSSYTQLPNIQFNKNSKYIAWSQTLQSTDYDSTGTVYSLAKPKSVLIMQDGNTRAAFWDGSISGHINPTQTPRNSTTNLVVGASNTSPITITLANPLIIGSGEQVTITDVVGNTAANGTWIVSVLDSTHLNLNGSTGNGNFVSNGTPIVSTIINASQTSPIIISLQSPIFIQTGETVTVRDVVGNTAADGTWSAVVIDNYTIALAGTIGNAPFSPPPIGGIIPTLTSSPTATLTTNPTASGEVATLPGYDGTPIGLWSVWSNNRLWISNGNKVYASDIGNPLKFTEDQYFDEARSFLLPNVCTGAIESPDKSGVVFFTRDVGVFFLSSIQDRTTWQSTPGFQTTICPNLGCCAPRSLVQQYGLIWWFTPKGLISQNAAFAANISSRLDVADNEMIQSKANLSFDLSMVAGGTIENYLFHALAHGDSINNRVHVLDQAPFEGKMDFWRLNSWPGFWTGWRPVEFTKCIIGTAERVFFCSQDYDGVNRMWEFFRDEKTDNGMPITSYVVTKTHFFGNRDYKNFRYAEVELVGVQGPTAVMVGVAGIRGAYQVECRKDINATIGQVYANYNYGQTVALIAGSSPQTRVIRTQDNPSPECFNDNDVEATNFVGFKDKAFSLVIAWSGIAGVTAYRIFAQNYPYAQMGVDEEDETGDIHLLNSEGAGTTCSVFENTMPIEKFYAEATFTKRNPQTAELVSRTCYSSSMINQQDAQRKAQLMAEWYVLTQIGEII